MISDVPKLFVASQRNIPSSDFITEFITRLSPETMNRPLGSSVVPINQVTIGAGVPWPAVHEMLTFLPEITLSVCPACPDTGSACSSTGGLAFSGGLITGTTVEKTKL